MITTDIQIILGEIAAYIFGAVLALLIYRIAEKLPVSSKYVPWLLTALAFLFMLWATITPLWGGFGGTIGLGILTVVCKRLYDIEELRPLKEIIEEYVERMGEAWLDEVKSVLEKYLKEE